MERLVKHATYEDLFEKMLDAGFLLDKQTFEILDTNEACERVLGYIKEELVGKKLSDFFEKEHREEGVKGLRVSRRRYYPRKFDSTWRHKEGHFQIMEVQSCVLKLSDDREVLQVIAKDVTRARKAEEESVQYLKDLKEANQKLEELSTTDEMTKLSNYRSFKKELEKEHERAERYGTPYAIVFIDIDYFKKLNDTHGHQAGDEVLRSIGKVLKKQSRNTDFPARYGGEEFIVLCAGVPWEGAMKLAERIRSEIESIDSPYGKTQPLKKITASFGVSGFPNHASSPGEMIEKADESLYHSKENGRNQITSFEEISKQKKHKKKPKAA